MSKATITPEELQKRLADANNLLEIQGEKGNWNMDEYMCGMFNGMELLMSVFEGREPKFRARSVGDAMLEYHKKHIKGNDYEPTPEYAYDEDGMEHTVEKSQS